jgi:mRNA-degrading endonuclease YafQ of YafQ-DinJ toxin-antitoxin module
MRTKNLVVRLTEKEYAKLQLRAELEDISVSEVVRDLIKKMPLPKKHNSIGNQGDIESF